MRRKAVTTLLAALTLTMSLSACGSTPTSTSNDSDIAELEQRIEELEAENKELKAQIENSDSTDNYQQSEADSLLQATIQSPETSGVCGADLTWYYQNGVLAITGTGEMTDYGYNGKDIPWYDIKDKIGWVIIDDGVTTIGENAFYNLGILSKVELPNTLRIIKREAFYNCNNLKDIIIPNSITSIETQAFNDGIYDSEDMTIVYNGQTYTEEEFANLAKELNIGDSNMFGWEAGEAPAAHEEAAPAE